MGVKARRRALVAGVLAILAVPGLAAAAQDWSVDADRASVPKNDSTAVRLTFTAHDRVGCVRVLVPNSYNIGSAAVVSASHGANWSTSIGGSSTHWVTAKAVNNGNDSLEAGDQLVLRITVSGTASGRADWRAWAYDKRDCDDEVGQSNGITMTVSGAAPTPHPTPKPSPKPKPKPKPTPTPHATAAPTAAPRVNATPRPESTPKPTAKPVTPPRVQATLAPTLAPVAIVRSTTPPPSGGEGSGALPKDFYSIPLEDGRNFGGLALELLAALGVFDWAVPGAILTVPGLLLIVIIGAQTFGAFAWLPIIRRKLRGTGVSLQDRLPGSL
jgi:hypothetical protein